MPVAAKYKDRNVLHWEKNVFYIMGSITRKSSEALDFWLALDPISNKDWKLLLEQQVLSLKFFLRID